MTDPVVRYESSEENARPGNRLKCPEIYLQSLFTYFICSPSGHIYSREAIVEYLLSKTQDLKRQRVLYEVRTLPYMGDFLLICRMPQVILFHFSPPSSHRNYFSNKEKKSRRE